MPTVARLSEHADGVLSGTNAIPKDTVNSFVAGKPSTGSDAHSFLPKGLVNILNILEDSLRQDPFEAACQEKKLVLLSLSTPLFKSFRTPP